MKLAEDTSYQIAGLAGAASYFRATKLDCVLSISGVEVTRAWSTQLNKNRVLGRVLNGQQRSR